MKILLWADVEHVGKRGDEVQVRRGHARNFLFPRKLASPPAPGFRRAMEREKKRADKLKEKELAGFKEAAAALQDKSITIEMRATAEGQLFGSVTAQRLAEEFSKEGSVVDVKQIVLDEPIKALGVYPVVIKLHPEISATARVWIVEAKDSAKAEEAGGASETPPTA